MSGNRICLHNRSAILEYDPDQNTFDLLPGEAGEAGLRRAGYSLECTGPTGHKIKASLKGQSVAVQEAAIQDAQGEGRQLQISGVDPARGLKITYLINSYPQHPFFLLRMRVENPTSATFWLAALNLIEVAPAAGGEVLLGQKNYPLDFFKVGWHDWVYSGLRHGSERDVNSLFLLKHFTGNMLYNPATPIGGHKGEFWGDNWSILTDQRAALLAGLASMAEQFGLLHVDCRPGKAALTLSALADGVPLEPGESFESEWGYLEWMALPVQDPMAEYVEAVARQMKPRRSPTPPPAMWTHWYYYFEHITQEQILENLEAADRLRKQIPYEIFQLDGGYYRHWGDWLDWNERFPTGPLELSKRIEAKGFTPGIWLAPFVVDPASKTAQQHPDWLVKDTQGKPIHSGFFYSFYGNALDLTQPAVLEHIRSLMDTLVHEMGYGFIKTDFVYAGALPGVRQNRKMTRAQAFRKGMEAVREGIGEETYLLGCGCPMGPAIGIVDAIRVGPDTAPNWNPFLWSTPWATALIKEDRSVAALRNNIRQTINLSSLHRRWWWNDPDCLMVRSDNTTLTEAEMRSNASLIGTSGNLIIHSDNLNKLSPEQVALAGRMTPNLEIDGAALDLLENEMAETYVAHNERAAGRWSNVALFNWGDAPADKRIELKKLGFEHGKILHLFDFWEEKHSYVNAPGLEFEQIPAHGCKLLRLSLADGTPCLVGDTLHTSQGGEIIDWCLSGRSLSMMTMDMKREVSGGLWFWLPDTPLKVVLNEREAPFSIAGKDIFRVQVSFNCRATMQIFW
jgi:alpha-galactosidase